jgi:hypothetical protein
MNIILTNNSKIKQTNGRNKTHPPPNINLTVNFEPPNKRKKRDTNLALRNNSFYSDINKTTKRKLKAKNTKPT